MYYVRSDYFLPLAPISHTNLRNRQKRGTAGREPIHSRRRSISIAVGPIFFGRGRRSLLSSSSPRFVAAHYAFCGLGATHVENGNAKEDSVEDDADRARHHVGITTEVVTLSQFKCQRYATSITPSTMRASLIYLSLLNVVVNLVGRERC